MASVPENRKFELQQRLDFFYINYGFLDRYFEIISGHKPSSVHWADASTLVFNGLLEPDSGFTAHPRYLEISKALGLIDLWEERGAPDFCEKLDEQWVCS